MKMKVSEAAKELGMSPMGLRNALRQGRFKEFGQAWFNEEKWTYYINRNRFEKYIEGEPTNTVAELSQRLREV